MEYARADALLDFEDEGVRASKLIVLERSAEEFDLRLWNAACDKLPLRIVRHRALGIAPQRSRAAVLFHAFPD